MALAYRADIDGLRAIAVLAVVLFHAGVPAFSGGYVGVDVFFVISGYLITLILRREIGEGRYALTRFYERRVRRILPALIVMSTVTVLLAGFLLLPSMNRTVPSQSLAALGFVANLYFWRTADYFGPSVETLPFLHTWSLGVEEQFYIFMPLAMALLVRHARRHQAGVLAGAAALSFALSVALTPGWPVGSFYLLPTRAWELLAGALLTYAPPAVKGSRRGGELLAVTGFVLLGVAIFGFDGDTPFPGYHAALPVAGAMLLIRAAPGTRVGALLSFRPVVGIGLISYSLYLWHWPVVVFLKSGRFEVAPWLAPPVIVGLSILLAFLSWRYVERPFRTPSVVPARRLAILVLAGCIGVIGAGVALRQARGNFGVLDPREVAFDKARYDVSALRFGCHLSAGVGRSGGYCVRGDGSRGDLTVWADSHGVELADALAALGYRVTVITYSACPPAPGFDPPLRPQCRAHNARVLEELLRAAPGRVVLAANYPAYPASARASLAGAADALAAAGSEVVLVGAMPTPRLDVPSHLAYGRGSDFSWKAGPGERLPGLAPRIRVVDPADLFCRGGTCSMLSEGVPLLYDTHHPSLSAARRIAGAVSAVLDETL